MKRLLTLFLALLMTASLAACGGGEEPAPAAEPQNQEDTLPPVGSEGEGEGAEWTYAFSKEHIDAIADVLAELEPLYNQAAALAIENGWENDELTVQELNTVYVLVDTGRLGVSDPGSYGDEMDDETMAFIVEQYQTILGAMPDLIERVSVPCEAEGESGN